MKKIIITLMILASAAYADNMDDDLPMEVLEAQSVLNLQVEEPFTLGHYIVNRDNWYKKFVKGNKNDMQGYYNSNRAIWDTYTGTGEGPQGPIVTRVLGKNKQGNMYVVYTYGDIAMKLLVKYDGDFIGFDYSSVECKYSDGRKFKFDPTILRSAYEVIKESGFDIMEIENSDYTF